MTQMLKTGQRIEVESDQYSCVVKKFLGGGTQGEVYKVKLRNEVMALKWYFPSYLKDDEHLRKRLEMLIENGPPNNKFLWPLALTFEKDRQALGYIMPLREPNFKSSRGLMRREIEPSFRSLTIAGFELAYNFFQLHRRGYCYRDISLNNVFINPDTGDIRICDNDNVDTEGRKGGIFGTPRFMAPELIRGESWPNRETDLFSLAVLLFYILMIHHPLEGKKEANIHSFDMPAMQQVYGYEPVFIFDPTNDSNHPLPGYHDNALVFWEIYPEFLKKRFTEAFTDGIHKPNGRIAETVWQDDLVRLHDSIIYCISCGSENFYDSAKVKVFKDNLGKCWNCSNELQIPPRIRIGNKVIILNHNSKLFPHHINNLEPYNFSSQPVAKVIHNDNKPNVLSLKNLSNEKWTAITTDKKTEDVMPGESVTIAGGVKIHFNKTDGEIRT